MRGGASFITKPFEREGFASNPAKWGSGVRGPGLAGGGWGVEGGLLTRFRRPLKAMETAVAA